jgi:hypothetical protein
MTKSRARRPRNLSGPNAVFATSPARLLPPGKGLPSVPASADHSSSEPVPSLRGPQLVSPTARASRPLSSWNHELQRDSNPCFSVERADCSLTWICRTAYAQTRENRVGSGSHCSNWHSLCEDRREPSSAHRNGNKVATSPNIARARREPPLGHYRRLSTTGSRLGAADGDTRPLPVALTGTPKPRTRRIPTRCRP